GAAAPHERFRRQHARKTGAALLGFVAIVAGLAARASPAPVQRHGDAVPVRTIAVVHTRRAREPAFAGARSRTGRLHAASLAAVRIRRARGIVADAGHHVAEIPLARHLAVDARETPELLVATDVARGK